jgi:peptide/nickel transport system permease protein
MRPGPGATLALALARPARLRIPVRATLQFGLRRPIGAAGGLVILAMALVALGAPLVAPYDPYATDYTALLSGPGPSHWLGTDAFGRDVFSRLVYGSRTALVLGISCALLGATAGVGLGAISGYFGGAVDLLLQRGVDFLLCFPALILALAVISLSGNGLGQVVLAITVPMVPHCARVARASALGVRQMPFVEAAQAGGATQWRILARHLMPNLVAPYLVLLTALMGQAILIEASLSFLGLGVAEPTPAWGLMLRGAAVDFAQRAPWLAIFPGCAISLSVFAFNLFGDALRDALDPRLRGAV